MKEENFINFNLRIFVPKVIIDSDVSYFKIEIKISVKRVQNYYKK